MSSRDFFIVHNMNSYIIIRIDKVLVDERIIRLIPQFLGSVFYKKKKFPVAVNLTKKNLKDEV